MKKHGSINLVYKFAGIFSLCILTSGFATAGTRDGGGGIGVRCHVPGKGSTLELLDLHEARQNGFAISYQPTSKEETIGFTAALISQHSLSPIAPDLLSNTAAVRRNLVEPIFNGTDIVGLGAKLIYVDSLPVSSDAGKYQIAPGCQLEQIAYFSDQDFAFYVVKEKWNEISLLDQAALVVHESSFYTHRHYGFLEDFFSKDIFASTSERTRSFVGKLFSKKGLTPRFEGTMNKPILLCATQGADSGLLASAEVNGGLSIVFTSVKRMSSPFKMEAYIANLQESDLLDKTKGNAIGVSEIKFFNEVVGRKFYVQIIKNQGSVPKIKVSATNLDGSMADIIGLQDLFCVAL